MASKATYKVMLFLFLGLHAVTIVLNLVTFIVPAFTLEHIGQEYFGEANVDGAASGELRVYPLNVCVSFSNNTARYQECGTVEKLKYKYYVVEAVADVPRHFIGAVILTFVSIFASMIFLFAGFFFWSASMDQRKTVAIALIHPALSTAITCLYMFASAVPFRQFAHMEYSTGTHIVWTIPALHSIASAMHIVHAAFLDPVLENVFADHEAAAGDESAHAASAASM
jgi:hypothetical protein